MASYNACRNPFITAANDSPHLTRIKSMSTYALCKLSPGCDTAWYLDCGDRWMTASGYYRQKSSDNQIIETAEAGRYEDLDHTKTDLLVPDSKWGWLSPSGQWYGCNFESHDVVAALILRKPQDQLDREGWIRVTEIIDDAIGCNREPTEAQRTWAFDNGRSFDR